MEYHILHCLAHGFELRTMHKQTVVHLKTQKHCFPWKTASLIMKRLTPIAVLNSLLCTLALLVLIISNIFLILHLDQWDKCTDDRGASEFISSNFKPIAANLLDPTSIQYANNADFNMYLSSLASSQFDPSSPVSTDCIVFLSDPVIINSTIGAIYNMREPVLGNWSGCIIVMGNGLIDSAQWGEVDRFFQCLNVYHLDITDDPLKETFPHVHYWKTYLMMHPFFRSKSDRFRYLMYLDSDCIAIHSIQSLIDRTLKHVETEYTKQRDSIWIHWREDYRHGSMYKAVLSLDKYDEATLERLKMEYPDHPQSKQGNVMILDMPRLPSVQWFESEIERIMNKYGKGFWRNDQSLFNLLFYHNSSDLGWTAFTNPPSEQLFYPPDNFPMVHTGGHQAMALRRSKENRGGIARAEEKAVYHALWEFWIYKLRVECPPRHDNHDTLES